MKIIDMKIIDYITHRVIKVIWRNASYGRQIYRYGVDSDNNYIDWLRYRLSDRTASLIDEYRRKNGI